MKFKFTSNVNLIALTSYNIKMFASLCLLSNILIMCFLCGYSRPLIFYEMNFIIDRISLIIILGSPKTTKVFGEICLYINFLR